MVNLLEKSYEELEICFKPHPGLKEKLYQHANWGKDKTEQYYNYSSIPGWLGVFLFHSIN